MRYFKYILIWQIFFFVVASYTPIVSHNMSTPLNFENNDSIRVTSPKGWATKYLSPNKVQLVIPDKSSSSLVLVETFPLTKIFNTKFYTSQLNGLVKNDSFEFLKSTQLAQVQIYKMRGKPLHAAVYSKKDYRNKTSYFGLLLSNEQNFNSLRADQLIKQIIDETVKVNKTKDRATVGNTTATITKSGNKINDGYYHSSSISSNTSDNFSKMSIDKDQLLGTWRVGSIGAYISQRSPAFSNVGETKIQFRFLPNNRYEVFYTSAARTGTFFSKTEVSDKGSFQFNGSSITLEPDSLDGWIFVGSKANKQKIKKTKNQYSFDIVKIGNGFGFSGDCLPYQVDSQCRKSNTSSKIFRLKNIR